MGKGALIIALGVSILISIVILNLNTNAKRNTTTTVSFYQDTKARIIANSGVEIYLEKLRRNKYLTGSFPNNSLMDGHYNVQIYGPDSALKIKCIANFDGVTHTSFVTASRIPVSIPVINAAIYVSAQNVSLNLNGNMEIDGNDHFMDGSLGGGAPVPGIGVDDPADSAFVINNLKNHISSDIEGLGGAPSVRSILDVTDWLTTTENFIFAADTVLPSGSYTTGTVLGTSTYPKITYVNGDVHFTGNANGAGIMVINGNIIFSGNFTFKGIVIAYGQSTIETKTVGNSGVFGASIFVGQTVDIQVTGSSQFFYSSQAINNAKNNLKSSRFKILSWWE